MARKRMLDPTIWDDVTFGTLLISSRLLFVGCISNADDEGRGVADPHVLRRLVFGFDDKITAEHVLEWRDEIDQKMRAFQLYEIDGREYYQLTKWKTYQYIQRPTSSKLPAPPGGSTGGRIPDSDDIEEYHHGLVISAWMGVHGTINPGLADEVVDQYEMIKTWLEKLPIGHPDKKRSAVEIIKLAIGITIRSADRPTLNYNLGILNRWMKNGVQSPKPGKKDKAAETTTADKNEVLKALKKRK